MDRFTLVLGVIRHVAALERLRLLRAQEVSTVEHLTLFRASEIPGEVVVAVEEVGRAHAVWIHAVGQDLANALRITDFSALS